MTIRMYAERHKMQLARVEVRLRHIQRATAQAGVTDKFERTIILSGELSFEERRRTEIAEHCPVSQTLQRPSAVVSRLSS